MKKNIQALIGLSFLFCTDAFTQTQGTTSNGHQLVLKTIQSHLIIKDYSSAVDEAASYLKSYPHDKEVWEAYIQALAKIKDENRMFTAWNAFTSQFPEEVINSPALKYVAWGVIETNAHASSPLIRTLSMIGALVTQDAKSIGILKNGLRDQNAFIRGLSAQISGGVRDDQICDEMIECLRKEVSWKVRLELIKSIGKMEMIEGKSLLLEMVTSSTTTMEEKAAAAEGLISLLDTVDRDTLRKLSLSNRAGLRYLSCGLIAHFDLKEDLDLIEPLLKDHRAEVRCAALETIGLLREKKIQIDSLLNDPDPQVAIYAAWVQTLIEPQKGQNAFKKWIFTHPDRNEKLLATSALIACGKYGMPLMREAFYKTDDPYLKINLGIGLIRQQVESQEALEAIYQVFTANNERWMWEEKGIFKYLAPSTVKHVDEIPHYPEAVNQLARLEILNLLAILRHPHSEKAIKVFLQEKKWGITGIASALLLTEGDDSALDLVQGLLKDPDDQIRLEAALMLALWGKEEDALKTLHEAYPQADRDTKEKILEAICKVGSPASLPFLIERLKEPYPSLRIITAAGILICLNH